MFAVAALTLVVASFAFAQAPRSSPPVPALPQTFFSSELPIRVVSCSHRTLASVESRIPARRHSLVTEREGRLRIVRNGNARSDADRRDAAGLRARARRSARRRAAPPVRGEPRHLPELLEGGENNLTTTALARGVFDGKSLKDVKDIFVANSWSKSNTNYGGRIAFDRAGLLYLTVGERQEQDRAQKPRRPRRQGAASSRRRERAAGQSVCRESRDTCRRSIRSAIAARRDWR